MRPLLLPANQPRSCYRGGARIAAFRGTPPPSDPYRPEDWIASTTARLGQAPAGLTTLPDGRLLRAAVEADPMGWLGRERLARHGADAGLLVKLLDTGERQPLHLHPDRDVARSSLAPPCGGAVAWVIVEADPDAAVHLGFSRDVDADELARWVADQKIETMLAVTNRVPVRAGDAVLCPAGVPHAIGAGILLVELREPTDVSVLLEWDGVALDGAAPGSPGLGAGLDAALGCVARSAWSPARIDAELRGAPGGRAVRDGIARLLPPAADGLLVAERVDARPRCRLDAAFAVLVVLSGGGLLIWPDAGETLEVRAGDTVVVPHGAGAARVEGPLAAVRARPAP